MTGLAVREGSVLLVASRYPNQPEPLWQLPGGRPKPGELAPETLVRELREETGLSGEPGVLRYASESYDRATGTHVLNLTFDVRVTGEPRVPDDDAHVVAVAWVPQAEVARRIAVAAVREPLVAALRGDARRYFGFEDAGITIAFAEPA